MSIILPTSFNVQTSGHIDTRLVVNLIADRDNIATAVRYWGMIVHVVDATGSNDAETYILNKFEVDDTISNNSNWASFAVVGGSNFWKTSGSTSVVNPFISSSADITFSTQTDFTVNSLGGVVINADTGAVGGDLLLWQQDGGRELILSHSGAGGVIRLQSNGVGSSIVIGAYGSGGIDIESSAQTTFRDFRTAGSQAGIEYFADYSADLTSNSLISKIYGDTHLIGKATITIDALNTNTGPGVAEDQYMLTWDNTAGEYLLLAGGVSIEPDIDNILTDGSITSISMSGDPTPSRWDWNLDVATSQFDFQYFHKYYARQVGGVGGNQLGGRIGYNSESSTEGVFFESGHFKYNGRATTSSGQLTWEAKGVGGNVILSLVGSTGTNRSGSQVSLRAGYLVLNSYNNFANSSKAAILIPQLSDGVTPVAGYGSHIAWHLQGDSGIGLTTAIGTEWIDPTVGNEETKITLSYRIAGGTTSTQATFEKGNIEVPGNLKAVSLDLSVNSIQLIRTAHIQLSQAQIQALNTTTIEIIPQPATGVYIQIIAASASLNHNATSYAVASKLRLIYQGITATILADSFASFISGAGDVVTSLFKGTVSGGQLSKAKALHVYADADATGAGGTIDVYVQYVLIDTN